MSKARHGETFVSMAISCWEVNQHEEAVRLTKQGLDLMEQAANDGQLDKSALAVPYSNLGACTNCWATRNRRSNTPSWQRVPGHWRRGSYSLPTFSYLLFTVYSSPEGPYRPGTGTSLSRR